MLADYLKDPLFFLTMVNDYKRVPQEEGCAVHEHQEAKKDCQWPQSRWQWMSSISNIVLVVILCTTVSGMIGFMIGYRYHQIPKTDLINGKFLHSKHRLL